MTKFKLTPKQKAILKRRYITRACPKCHKPHFGKTTCPSCGINLLKVYTNHNITHEQVTQTWNERRNQWSHS